MPASADGTGGRRGNHAAARSPIRATSTRGRRATVVDAQDFTTDGTGKADCKFKLPAGIYRAVLETTGPVRQEGHGAAASCMVLEPGREQFTVKIPNFVGAPKWSLEPGDEFMALWGTGYDKARAFVEVEHRGKILQELLDRGRHDAAVGQASA